MAGKTSQDYASQKALTDTLFNSIGDGAITTDGYGHITRINPTAQKILGYSENEVLGQWLPRILETYDKDGIAISLIERPSTKAFVSGNIISDRVQYKTKDGILIPVAMTISPIIIKGEPVGCIEIFRDITEEYEIDKMKSDFISLASHQLRTPLSSIKTYTHMLVDGYMGTLSKDQTKSLKTIISATNRMNETISTLLNISRIESQSIAIIKKSISLNQIIEGIVKEHTLFTTEKNIKVDITDKIPGLKIISDPNLLKEIFQNLMSNAIKYTPANGQINVLIRMQGNKAIVSIKDNGLGIPLDSQDNIFSKFFRAKNVIREETSGTGLGLYVAKGLLNQLGGDIWFKSTEGKGSTFYASIPILPQKKKMNAVKK